MPIKSKIADPKTQNNSKTMKAVVLLLKVNLRMSLLVSPCVKVANIGSKPIGSMATKIITKFSMKRFNIFAVYYLASKKKYINGGS